MSCYINSANLPVCYVKVWLHLSDSVLEKLPSLWTTMVKNKILCRKHRIFKIERETWVL